MGSAISNEAEAGRQDVLDSVIGHEYGFRVHRIEPNSPGQAAGLQSVLDYIVVANGVRLDHDDGNFVRMIAENKGKPMRLCVFDTRSRSVKVNEACACGLRRTTACRQRSGVTSSA